MIRFRFTRHPLNRETPNAADSSSPSAHRTGWGLSLLHRLQLVQQTT